MPTLSQLVKSWNKLLSEVRIIIVRNRSKYLINRFRGGSECTLSCGDKRATGRKIIDKKSNLKLSVNFIVPIVIQCQLVMSNSVLELKNEVSGIRLIKNIYMMCKFT